MRGARAVLAAALAVAGALYGSGCGTKFELPTESPRTPPPGENTYFVKYRWAGFAGARDILMTRGGEVLVAEPRPGGDSLRVRGYYRSRKDPTPTGLEMPGLAFPIRIAEGAGGALFVLDDAKPPVVNRYGSSGQSVLATFTDPDWLEVVDDTTRPDSRTLRVTNSSVTLRGLAADDANNVYVAWSDSAFHEDLDLIDSTRSFSVDIADIVRKYTVDGTPIVDLATRGTGTGFVETPGGLAVSEGALYYADVGKDWVQKVSADVPASPISVLTGLDLPGDPGFLRPLDVAVDDSGFVYVTDTGKGRVVKYDRDGVLDMRIDIPDSSTTEPTETVEPIAVTASRTLALVLDKTLGMILIYELRSGLETKVGP
jgi:hypothetical protein